MKNLEVKAGFQNFKKAESLLKQLGAKKIKTMRQIDTYFRAPFGKLKLRVPSSTNSELIFYERKEDFNQRWSNYYILHITKPKDFIEFFRKAFPIEVIVDKTRILYRYKKARIHLDRVVKLGKFIEIEVEVNKDNAQAKKLMKELLVFLKIPQKDFIKKSYSDLLLAKTKFS